MTIPKITLVVLTAASALFIEQYYINDTDETNLNLVNSHNLLNDNTPVHMAGCKTYEPPVAPKVIYPTVTKNFITRLCALEVPPPYGVIALQRSNAEKELH